MIIENVVDALEELLPLAGALWVWDSGAHWYWDTDGYNAIPLVDHRGRTVATVCWEEIRCPLCGLPAEHSDRLCPDCRPEDT